MKVYLNRILVLILIQLFALIHLEASGQDTDSLDVVINRILEENHNSRNLKQVSDGQDTLSVLNALSEGKRYARIHSDSSYLFIRKALDISFHSRSPRFISLAVQNLGHYYLSKEMYKEAMSCYLKSLKIEEMLNTKNNNRKRIAELYDDLGSVYYFMELFYKSLHYHESSLKIFELYKDTLSISRVLSHLGSLHSSREFCERRTTEEKKGDFKKAISYFEQSIQKSMLAGDGDGIARGNQNIAAVYNKLDRPDIALGYIEKSLDYYRKKNDPEGILGTEYTIGKTYYKLKDYTRSIAAFRESERIALERNLTEGIQYLYEAFATTYNDTKDYRNAYNYYVKYMTIRDSVYNAEKSRQVFELETRYQTQVKQNQILRLLSDKRKKNSLIYLLSGVILILVSASYFNLRIIKKNKIIAAQDIEIREKKITELETERQLLASRSLLEGEEAERSRLASDLHNGLGGLLSGIKINLSSMKENSILTQENVNAFNHAISLLDTSITELRRIAHNLMPETLNNYGLRTALEDFGSQVSPAGLPELAFRFFGEDTRYTREIELSIYRITQELINNALKHSGATSINIHLISEKGRLCVQVTDNGKGFTYDLSKENNGGKGLRNISNRVTALNGKFDIWSQPGQGTEISVELEIPET